MSLLEKFMDCGCKVTTDSRKVQGGEIFFALSGENFDGNRYAALALESGAAWAVVSASADLPENERFIRVEDPLAELQNLAADYRRSLSIPVIGLTGTNGKTTTKELIRTVLSAKFKVAATQGNFNNDIGVPLTLLSIPADAQIAVVEMGANHPDDIARLVKISQPDYGLITNVGRAHLQGFGSFEGVKAAKGELYKWLAGRPGSVIFLNADDDDLCGMSHGYPCHFWSYGIRYQKAEILPSSVAQPFLRLVLDGDTVCSNLVGAYNATNVLAALAVGEYFGVPCSAAIEAIASYVPSNGRSQMFKSGTNFLIADAYNANPSSMSAALDNFKNVEARSKLALLGDMRELGTDSFDEHLKIVLRLAGEGIDAMLVGEEFSRAAEGFPFLCFATSEELAVYLRDNPIQDTTVLVKGSRGTAMEKVFDVLKPDF